MPPYLLRAAERFATMLYFAADSRFTLAATLTPCAALRMPPLRLRYMFRATLSPLRRHDYAARR